MKPKLSILDPNPTPLQYLSGLSQELFREIYIKRDDLTPFGGGGNKLRKLEYLMIEALNSQATTIVTVGGPQTNHGRLTAAVASASVEALDIIICAAFSRRLIASILA